MRSIDYTETTYTREDYWGLWLDGIKSLGLTCEMARRRAVAMLRVSVGWYPGPKSLVWVKPSDIGSRDKRKLSAKEQRTIYKSWQQRAAQHALQRRK